MFTLIRKNKSLIAGVMLWVMLLLTVSGCSDPGSGKTPEDSTSDTGGQSLDTSEPGTGGKPLDTYDPDDDPDGGDDGDEDEIIQVGQYTLHLGEYRLLNGGETVDDPEGIILLTEDAVVFGAGAEEEESFKYKVEGSALMIDGQPLLTVTGDDRLDMGGAGVIIFVYTGGGSTTPPDGPSAPGDTPEDIPTGVNIRPSETAALQLVDYDGGEFTMKIPAGWVVSKGGYNVYYGIRVYDPNDDRNQIFYILKISSLYKSSRAIEIYKWYNYDIGIYIDGPGTTEQIFKVMNDYAAKMAENQQKYRSPDYVGFEFPRINNFTVVESFEGSSPLRSYAVDDKVLRATFNNGSAVNDGEAEGLFQACVVSTYALKDLDFYMAYNVSGVTAARDQLVNYQEILLQCLNSIEFTESYVQTTVDQIDQTTQTALDVGAQLNQAYQSYNDAWSARQKSYDIQSQKQSDLTLGYERVVDTETGSVYRAYNGFADDDTSGRFQPAADPQYAEPIAGYIEKK